MKKDVEMLLTEKYRCYSNTEIEAERLFTQKFLPGLESFLTFTTVNEVYDSRRKKQVTYLPRLAKAFLDKYPEPFVFIVNKN